ncbi:MAG: hypothetical protein KF716_21835 [Anaerolineae bacterium]|nr:hypothetical protein [Anaerolineae bacterium]
MPRPATGRRPDSLFDNRYRYDYIYPRGRSGETLRAYDTQRDDAPVVIKRPALQDAPPIRAGQEQSILREKRALELLAGHPVLTELRHTGSFRVGGQLHQYIVMDMAQGTTMESMVLGLAQRGERLPDLELLTILDQFLDLLQLAHDKAILYNDVDAKHLFWDRDHYRLKLIDWGNAVFLDSDSAPHASRASDILQVGQMLYFVLSGGHRLEASRADAALDLADSVPQRLKEITARATSPDVSQRYATIAALRQDLAEVRRPLEKSRDVLVERARSRLGSATTQSQLEEVRGMLQEALTTDPGYPAGRDLLIEVELHLNTLAIQADLDAVRIYIESGSVGRASALLTELQAKSGGDQPILAYLRDLCEQLREGNSTPPAGLLPALDALFKNDAVGAGKSLVTTIELRPEAKLRQFRLAQRLTQFMPGVTLLRPHLIVLQDELSRQTTLTDALRALELLIFRLDDRPSPGIQPLVLHYGRLSEGLSMLESKLQAQPALLSLLALGKRAADDIIDLLEVVAHNALSDSKRAGNALWQATTIDPASTAFKSVDETLNQFHQELESLQRVVPQSDGSNIREFLLHAQSSLGQYAAEISDPAFQQILRGIDDAIRTWSAAIDYLALGGKRPAADATRFAAQAIQLLNIPTAQWFEDSAHKIEEATRIEYLSPNVVLGRTLAEGWDAWDKGRGGEAQAAGERALSAAATEGEKLAAQRLIDLGEALSSWLASDGSASPERTDRTQKRVAGLLLPDEEQQRRKFNEQMPSMQTYLKAMVKGVVEPMRDASSAALRALFFDYALRGILALKTEAFEEADFWRECASRALPNAKVHPAYQALDGAITRRHLILEAVRVINNTRSPAQLVELRQAVRQPLASAQLEQADQSVRSLDEALKKWPDGEFRTARQHLDVALDRITAAEIALGKELSVFKTWLQDLAASAELLAQTRRSIEQAAVIPTEQPDPDVAEGLKKLVDITRRDLGEAYTAQLRQWRDTYTAIRDVYVDDSLSKDEKLRLFESHFAAMFIDRQPALPIMRYWQNTIKTLPDEPEPEAPHIPVPAGTVPLPPEPEETAFVEDIPEPPSRRSRAASERRTRSESTDSAETAEPPSRYGRTAEPTIVEIPDQAETADEPQYVPFERKSDAPTGIAPRLMVIGAVVVAVVVIGTIFFLLRNRDNGNNGGLTVTLNSPTAGTNVVAAGSTDEATNTTEPIVNVPTMTLEPSNTPAPATDTPPPTDTAVPSATNTTAPTETPTSTPIPQDFVPTPTIPQPTPLPAPTEVSLTPTSLSPGQLIGTPVPTNPALVAPTALPEATNGTYELIDLLGTLPTDKITWDTAWFGPGSKGWQLGNTNARLGASPSIKLGTDILTELLGTDAPTYLKRVDATLELTNYTTLALTSSKVFFGVGVETVRTPRNRADARARLAQENLLDVGPSFNGSFRRASQIPVTTVSVKLSVVRNDDRTISLYYNDQLLGTSDDLFPLGAPLSIYFYTGSGGVLVNVTSLQVTIER